ncbi:MAG: hypothetical protein DMD56_13790 [Gemmatimonadetes bacterium]|nr:MAG: hypothetical protein DMD56_13790 [Gemmatimonadota bacterium]
MGTAARGTGYLPPAPMRAALASFLLPASLLTLVGCVSEHGPLTNRMAQSTTPYLARAARQPVSWQPWGRDAFALAARLDRPVLLYVGADDCRWCGVMDREVYGDPGLGPDAGSNRCFPTWPGATESGAAPSCGAPRSCGSAPEAVARACGARPNRALCSARPRRCAA